MDRDPKGYYAALFVAPDASDEEIKKAYRRVSRGIHPDGAATPEERAWKEEAQKKVNAAHDILGDPKKRAAYDQQSNGAQTQAGSSQTQGQPPQWQQTWSTPPPPSTPPQAPSSPTQPPSTTSTQSVSAQESTLRWWEAVILTVLQAAVMLGIGFGLSVLASPWARESLGGNSSYREGIHYLLKVTMVTVLPPIVALCVFNALACRKPMADLGGTIEKAWRASLTTAVVATVATTVATAIDTSVTSSPAAPLWAWWVVPVCISVVFVGILARDTEGNYIVVCGSAVAALALAALSVHAEPALMLKICLIAICSGVVSGIAFYALDLVS